MRSCKWLGRVLTICLLVFLLFPLEGKAAGNYKVILEDDADLLSPEEEAALKEDMQGISEYGNVAFKSVQVNSSNTDAFAERYYYSTFGTESGIVFIIDMDNRNIWIESDGAIEKRIDKDYAEVITDNIYRYATEGDYYECGRQAYVQILTLLDGGRIAQPMKYICNGLLAISLALIINFLIMRAQASSRGVSMNARMDAAYHYCDLEDSKIVFLHKTKVYSPRSSGSSGGGGGGGGGGGSSGGGHSF